jgi:hypothetical protein
MTPWILNLVQISSAIAHPQFVLTLLYVKTLKYTSKGIRDNSHVNLIFLKLKLVYQSNKIINFIKSKAKMFHDEVELNFMK